MKPKRGQASQKQPDKNNQSQPPIKNNVKNASTDEKTNGKSTNEHQTIQTEPTKIIIVDDQRSNKQAIWANVVSTVSLIVAVTGFIFAYLLFNETKNQYVKQNQSFLQLKNFTLASLKEDEKMIISYDRINTGNLPILIKSGKYGYTFAATFENNPFDSQTGDTLRQLYSNIFVTQQAPMGGQFITKNPIPAWIVNKAKIGEFDIFFYGQIQYENVASKDSFTYTFNIKLTTDNPDHSIAVFYDTKKNNEED
ncbi:MAG: hypothetical protein M3R72_04120 [Bacteroidota bacterium]|nr:hypothetical protein [Bacteroidota bacterium]